MNGNELDEKELEELKAAYVEALYEKKETFIFRNIEFLTVYAKYLIEFLNLKK